MSEPYYEMLKSFHEGHAKPHQYMLLQMCFLVYLILGQLGALALWRPLVPVTRRWSAWKASLAFGLYLLGVQVVLFAAWPQLVGAWLRTDNVLLADVVITTHLLLVVSLLLVLLLIPVGGVLGWKWTRRFWLRLTHLVIIEIVTGQAIVGIECPMMTLERHLRHTAARQRDPENVSERGKGYLFPESDEASAIGYWSNEMLYSSWGPMWVYAIIYSCVGLLVLLTWIVWPPRLPWRDGPATDPTVPILDRVDA